MSTNYNLNNGSDSASNGSGQKVPVSTTQTSGSVSTTLTTTARTLTQPPTLPHIISDSARTSQSPSSSANTLNINADISASQRTSTSSTATTPFVSQKTRKLVPRSRLENEDRQAKSASSPSAAVQQGQVVAATSSPGNNTYVIRDNEGRWFLLQTNAGAGTPVHQSDTRVALPGWRNVPSASAAGQLPELPQSFTKPAMQPQQMQHNQIQQLPSQLIKSNLLAGNATLGQLARSLAPKPTHSASAVSNASPMSMINTQSGTVPQQGTPRPTLHQANTSPATQTQASVVGHYPAIRPAANQNAQLVTMINGYYVQSLPPNVSVPTSLPQQSTLVSQAKIAASAAQHTSVTSQSTPVQSHMRIHSVPSGVANLKQVPQIGNQPQMSSAALQCLEKVLQAKTSESGRSTVTSNAAVPTSHIQNMVPTTVGTLAAPPSAFVLGNNKLSPCGKGRGIDDKLQRAGAAPSVASTGIMPNGTPIMLMPNGAISQPGTISASGTPLLYPGGQGIRQQLVSTSALPGQILPVFQQQQNLPRFASTPTSQSPGVSSVRRRPDGDTESGVENEPPSIECHGESKEAHRVRLMFLREAEAFREQLGSESRIVHSIDGIEILESDSPFPSAPPVPLEEWMPRGPREASTNELRSPAIKEDNSFEEERPMDTDVVSSGVMNKSPQKDNYITPRKKTVKSPPTSSGSPDKTLSDSKKHRKRRTNEVDKLLQMDFGPSQGRLRDILQNSENSGEKKTESKHARASSDDEELGAVSMAAQESPAGRLEGPSEEKVEDQIPPLKEKKRRGRLPGKKNLKSAGEKQTASTTKESATAKSEIHSKEEAAGIIGDVSATGERGHMEESGRTDQRSEIANAAESSLNSSVESAVDLGVSVGNISLSDEDADTERCIYCDGFLRVKRLVSHPQYCSKKCRKLWKKNPINSGTRPIEPTVPQLSFSNAVNAATSSNVAPPANLHSPTNSAPVSPEAQPRPARTLILKMGSLANPEAVQSAALGTNQEINVAAESHHCSTQKSASRVYLPSAQSFPVRASQTPETQAIVQSPSLPPARVSTGYVSPVLTPPKVLEPRERAEFPEGHPRMWTCDEVASWVTRITGADTIGEKFRSQDVDGQSLLLMAESEEGIAALLTQKLHLKLGPVLKLEKALKDLIARSTEP